MKACWKIEATPRAGSARSIRESILWIRKSNYTYAQIDNFSGDKLIRRIDYRDVQQMQDIWTARTIEVQDLPATAGRS